MTMRPLRLLPLLVALCGCVDFVDPSGLRLEENTRINIDLTLSDFPAAGCPADPPVTVIRPPGTATVCVTARVRPGRDLVGERDRLRNDTLYAMGTALTPEIDEDSTYVYRGAFRFPVTAINDTVYEVVFPTVEGVRLDIDRIRWVAIEPLGPDTILRTPTQGAVIPLALPTRTATPPPRDRFWQVIVAGQTAIAQYNGSGVPLSAYDFPASVLAGLGGDRFAGRFEWRQSYSRGFGDQRVSVTVFFTQVLGWTIRTVRP